MEVRCSVWASEQRRSFGMDDITLGEKKLWSDYDKTDWQALG